jgi:hypothetical protein
MRSILTLALLFAPALAQAATASPGSSSATPAATTRGVAAAFGNTVKAQYPDGRFQRLWLHADGSWDAVGRRGYWSSGKWALKDSGKVCLKQAKPFPAPFKYCTDFPTGSGVGAVWTSKDMSGEPIRLTVVPGIQKPAGGAGS